MPSQGLARDIIITWNMVAVKVNIFHISSQFIAIVVSESNQPTWLLCGVYASTSYREKNGLGRGFDAD